MPLYCPGQGCPLRADCYRHTQPSPGRDRFAALPYSAELGTCESFITNIPSEDAIRQAAYFIWLRGGRAEGDALGHWDEAYQSLCRSMGRNT